MRIVGVLHFMAQLSTWRSAQYGDVRGSSHNNNIAFIVAAPGLLKHLFRKIHSRGVYRLRG